MEREQALDALYRGNPIARDYEKYRDKYNSARLPYFLTAGIIVISLMTMFLFFVLKTGNGNFTFFELFLSLIKNPGELVIPLTLCGIAVFILAIIPGVNLIFKGLAYLVGKLLFSNKQKIYRKKMTDASVKFTEHTELSRAYCNTTLITKYIGYLNSYQADNLKECAKVYKREEHDRKVLEQMEELRRDREELRSEISSLESEVDQLRQNR